MRLCRYWLMVLGLLCGLARAQTEAPDADWRYRIQPGDTLISLTDAWLAPPRSWRELQALNRVPDPLRLKPGSLLRMPVAWLRAEASVAELMFVKGQVSDAAGQPLAVGATLRSGDQLRTGPQSSASLRFADGSRLLIPPDSDLTLEQLLVLGRGALPAVRLGVTRGGADSQVHPNAQRVPVYELRTPHVNLGVRGTEFRVQADATATRLQVLQGAVHASGLGPDVAAGQGLLADARQRQVRALLPAPVVPALPTADRLPLQLAWPASPAGAVAWRAQLFEAGDFNRLLLDARLSAPALAWAEARELPDGAYTLRLRGIDAAGQEGLAADVAVQLQARPEPPFLEAPAADAVAYGSAVTLAWARNTAAPRVRLQVARDAGFADRVLDAPPQDAASRALDLPTGNYHWRVASVQADGRAGPFSEAQRFELRPPPPAPAPASSELRDGQLSLRWPAAPGAVRYELQWAPTEAFDTAVQALATEAPALSLPQPAPGRYFLRARSVNAAGVAGPWGQTQMIEQPHSRWLWLLPLLLIPLF